MQVVILCGGKGTRSYPHTELLPKPMMSVNGQPILLQVMRIFAEQGHREFILSVGYRKEIIIDYFYKKDLDWDIKFVDTGADTDTGGRIEKCKGLLRGTFFATYADGLADIDLDRLLKFHDAHDGMATITSVPLVSQYGTLNFDDTGKITSFQEKPVLRQYWINAGFFVMDSGVFKHWRGSNLEREVLPNLLTEGLLYTYRHDGFFKSMDTYKDQLEIEQMYREGHIKLHRKKEDPHPARRRVEITAT